MTPNQITIHHSASGPNTTVAEIDAWHKARYFTLSRLGYYVGYHYVIEPDGTTTQTRKDWEMGCHSIPNDGKIGICLIGDFTKSDPPTPQLDALHSLVESLKKSYNLDKVLGHRECNRTECPGDGLFKWVLTYRISWLQQLLNLLLNKTQNHV